MRTVPKTLQNYLGSLFLICCILSLVLTQNAYAASNQFKVRTLIGGDTAAPTVPGSFTATPIATSQIDLSWSASTDDWELAGYRVWRDAVVVATTTSTTYSDTGLTASTTYQYYVTAYDTSLNQSASSTVIDATTLDVPPVVPATSDGSQYGSRLTPFDEMIVSLQIVPGKDSALLKYETRTHIQSVVKWGSSISYEIGSLAEQSFTVKHVSTIADLAPDSLYSFSIEGRDPLGRYGVLYAGEFRTLPPDDVFPPGNVTNLTVEKDGDDVLVSWKNPDDLDFERVKVLRSDLFYPLDSHDGWLVYDGAEDHVRDVGAATGTRQFYTVFSYDALGNVSSGAVVSISFGTSTIPIINPEQNEISLSFDKVSVMQNGVAVPHEGSVVYIDGARQFTVSIPYDSVPKHLKTIIVRMVDSRNANRVFEFLLRADKDMTAYTGTIAPLGIPGTFPVSIAVFDYATKQVGYTDGTIVSDIKPIHTDSSSVTFLGGLINTLNKIGRSYITWTALLLVLLILARRRLTAHQ